MWFRVSVFCAVAAGLLAGCSPNPSSQAELTVEQEAITAPGSVPFSDRIGIAFLGDSLTAGLGLLSSQAYPAIIGEMFVAEGYDMVEIVNAGISGDTTAGGVRRLDQVLTPNIRILVVALGGNDALRGLTTEQTKTNLTVIIETALERGVEVLLVGMEAPTNLGADYRDGFRAAFTDVARAYQRQVAFVPFLLEGVAGQPQFNQADGIHPNEAGARLVAEHVYPSLRNLVDLIPAPGLG